MITASMPRPGLAARTPTPGAARPFAPRMETDQVAAPCDVAPPLDNAPQLENVPKPGVGRAVGTGLLYAAAFTVPTVLTASFGLAGFIGGVVADGIAGARMRTEEEDGTRGDMLLDGLGLGVVCGALATAGSMGLLATAATGTVVGALAVYEALRKPRA